MADHCTLKPTSRGWTVETTRPAKLPARAEPTVRKAPDHPGRFVVSWREEPPCWHGDVETLDRYIARTDGRCPICSGEGRAHPGGGFVCSEHGPFEALMGPVPIGVERLPVSEPDPVQEFWLFEDPEPADPTDIDARKRYRDIVLHDPEMAGPLVWKASKAKGFPAHDCRPPLWPTRWTLESIQEARARVNAPGAFAQEYQQVPAPGRHDDAVMAAAAKGNAGGNAGGGGAGRSPILINCVPVSFDPLDGPGATRRANLVVVDDLCVSDPVPPETVEKFKRQWADMLEKNPAGWRTPVVEDERDLLDVLGLRDDSVVHTERSVGLLPGPLGLTDSRAERPKPAATTIIPGLSVEPGNDARLDFEAHGQQYVIGWDVGRDGYGVALCFHRAESGVLRLVAQHRMKPGETLDAVTVGAEGNVAFVTNVGKDDEPEHAKVDRRLTWDSGKGVWGFVQEIRPLDPYPDPKPEHSKLEQMPDGSFRVSGELVLTRSLLRDVPAVVQQYAAHIREHGCKELGLSAQDLVGATFEWDPFYRRGLIVEGNGCGGWVGTRTICGWDSGRSIPNDGLEKALKRHDDPDVVEDNGGLALLVQTTFDPCPRCGAVPTVAALVPGVVEVACACDSWALDRDEAARYWNQTLVPRMRERLERGKTSAKQRKIATSARDNDQSPE